MLPSGRLMERWSSGMKVNGSGMALVYVLGGAGDLADGVDEHLGVEAAQRVVGEIRRGLGAVGCAGWRKAGRSAS